MIVNCKTRKRIEGKGEEEGEEGKGRIRRRRSGRRRRRRRRGRRSRRRRRRESEKEKGKGKLLRVVILSGFVHASQRDLWRMTIQLAGNRPLLIDDYNK